MWPSIVRYSRALSLSSNKPTGRAAGTHHEEANETKVGHFKGMRVYIYCFFLLLRFPTVLKLTISRVHVSYYRQSLVVLILVGFIAMAVSRPRPTKLVIREMGVGGEKVRDYQVEQDDLDDLSQEELGVRARAILGRKPTALESGKGPSNVRNSSENQVSPSVPEKTEEKSPVVSERTDEEPTVPVSTDGEVRASEVEPSIEEEELVENTYSKFKVKVVSGRHLAEVHVNDKVVSVRSTCICMCTKV